MSTVRLIKWGNSVGIRIPAQELKATNVCVGTQFDLSINEDGGFTLHPVKHSQAGWLEAFNAAADAGQDKLILENIENDFDRDEWTW